MTSRRPPSAPLWGSRLLRRKGGNRGGGMRSQSRGAIRPRFARTLSLLSTEGAGKTGCTLHPRSRVQYAQRNAHTSGLSRILFVRGLDRIFDLPVRLAFLSIALNSLRHSGAARRAEPGIHTSDLEYGFSDVQLHIIARDFVAPRNDGSGSHLGFLLNRRDTRETASLTCLKHLQLGNAIVGAAQPSTKFAVDILHHHHIPMDVGFVARVEFSGREFVQHGWALRDHGG